jgi:hypothetical protein
VRACGVHSQPPPLRNGAIHTTVGSGVVSSVQDPSASHVFAALVAHASTRTTQQRHIGPASTGFVQISGLHERGDQNQGSQGRRPKAFRPPPMSLDEEESSSWVKLIRCEGPWACNTLVASPLRTCRSLLTGR